MEEFDPASLADNMERFDQYLQKYEQVYTQAGIRVKRIADVDEFVADKETGEMTVVKRKVTKKQVPPDLNAAKLLFELTGEKQFDIASMSDEDLQNERQKLLDILEENNDKTN